MQDACPNPAVLETYATGAFKSPSCVALERHLETCPTCLERLLPQLPRGPVGNLPHVYVVGEIGRGSSGVVYKAWWTKNRPKLVALKMMSGGGERAPNRFDREIAVLKKLESPWIVKCFESGGADDNRYFVMDFVHGEHLDVFLQRPHMTLIDKLAVFERVCRAVACAHALGVVHRDLKPRNILVDEAGEPHILDFGICSVRAADWTTGLRMTVTHTGAILGTIKYMSPEQAWGGVAGPVDHRSDLWALGVMLHEIVTGGQHPYPLAGTRDKSPFEAVLERIRKELPRPARLAHLPRGRDLEILIERCLTRDPEHRLADAAQLADDLNAYEQGRRIRTRPHGWAYRASRILVGAATQSRVAFWLVFMALTLTLWWGPLFARRAGWVETRIETEPAPSALAGNVPHGTPDSFILLGITDHTPHALAEAARNAGSKTAEGFDLRDFRAIHGTLMKKLGDARPRAVLWDLWFRTPQRGDDVLAEGINALEAAGVPVVLISMTYDDGGRPHLSESILRNLTQPVRDGAVVARDMIHRPGEFVVAQETRTGMMLPGAALVLAESLYDPQARIELELHSEKRTIEVLYRLAEGAYRRDRGVWDNLLVYQPDDLPSTVRVACLRVELTPPDDWSQRVVPYEWALSAEPETLRERFRNKIVVIGDLRTQTTTPAPDRHRVTYPTGSVENVPGCFLLADAVRGLLSRRIVRVAYSSGLAIWALVAVAALAGCLLPVRLARLRMFELPSARATLMTALGLVAGLAWVWSGSTGDRGTFLATSVVFGVAGPLLGAFWLEFTRDRYRFLDRRFAAAGEPKDRQATVTWSPRPPTAHPGQG